VRDTRVTEDKIKLVKDLLPNTLKNDGFNPLDLLHSSLSAGLHSRSDEECLNEAEGIRISLQYLIKHVEEAKEEKKSFTDSMKKILDKRNKVK
jgi:hypothetical protein